MSASGRKKEIESDAVAMGFQIAPMIDVVFVIMLFFMVMAGAVKKEMILNTALPGVAVPTAEDIPIPDELVIAISEDGAVTMNEEEFDTPKDKKLPQLTLNLMRLKQDADARNSKVLVTLQAEEQARYERIIDVMNALAKAQISNMTFTVGTEEF